MATLGSVFRSERARILFEVAGFAAFALLSRAAVMQVTWRFAGPLSLALVLAVLTLYMHWRGLTWREFGLRPLPGLKAKLWVLPQALLVFAAFGVAVAATVFGGQALGLAFMAHEAPGVAERWGDIAGNLPLLLLWVALSWLAGGFAEEMFFRGFLVSRLQDAFGKSWIGSAAAVLLAAAFFGFGHMYYQGLRGLIVTGAIGVAFGSMFLVYRRNLWPIILVHGFVDSIGFIGTYMGWK